MRPPHPRLSSVFHSPNDLFSSHHDIYVWAMPHGHLLVARTFHIDGVAKPITPSPAPDGKIRCKPMLHVATFRGPSGVPSSPQLSFTCYVRYTCSARLGSTGRMPLITCVMSLESAMLGPGDEGYAHRTYRPRVVPEAATSETPSQLVLMIA